MLWSGVATQRRQSPVHFEKMELPVTTARPGRATERLNIRGSPMLMTLLVAQLAKSSTATPRLGVAGLGYRYGRFRKRGATLTQNNTSVSILSR
jgi:hypothetical protein